MTARCVYCGELVDAASPATWRRVQGWAKLVSHRSSGNRRTGISDIALRERMGDDCACDSCIRMLKAGRTPRQMELGA